ncbi:MAG: hypothetical protein RR891_00340 [Clostridium sp.]|uniref:hypothetical protein n=1 Tax=Clostridium sp. TaxID=1506 RepID=UPI00306CB4B7
MKNSIKKVIIINLISYVSNFLFSYTYSNKIIDSTMVILGVWSLTPYLILTVSRFIMATDNREEFKVFKKEALADWIVRAISCIIVFQEFKFGFMSREYIIQQAILSSLLLINVALEFKMYNKTKVYSSFEKNDKSKEKISEKEKQNIKNIGKASTLGLIY